MVIWDASLPQARQPVSLLQLIARRNLHRAEASSNPTDSTKLTSGRDARQTDIDFAVDIVPFGAGTQPL